MSAFVCKLTHTEPGNQPETMDSAAASTLNNGNNTGEPASSATMASAANPAPPIDNGNNVDNVAPQLNGNVPTLRDGTMNSAANPAPTGIISVILDNIIVVLYVCVCVLFDLIVDTSSALEITATATNGETGGSPTDTNEIVGEVQGTANGATPKSGRNKKRPRVPCLTCGKRRGVGQLNEKGICKDGCPQSSSQGASQTGTVN